MSERDGTRPARTLLAQKSARGAHERDDELCVVTACHQWVCALPARWVERLVVPHEVAIVASQQRAPSVLVGERQYGAWNLGTLLGLPPLGAAWVLLRLPYGDRELPIALNTGACLVVQALPPATALPPGAFRARPGAIAGAFATVGMRGRATQAALGLWLDPTRLLTADELAASVSALAAGGGE
jgi:hypothetical protein